MKNISLLKIGEATCAIALTAGVAGMVYAIYKKHNGPASSGYTPDEYNKKYKAAMMVWGTIAVSAFAGIHLANARLKK